MLKLSAIGLLLLNSLSVTAQEVPPADDKNKVTSDAQQVRINGKQSDIEAGRDFIAGRLIISRKSIEDSGLQNANDLLKREPTVTVGKDGRISLMGLNGYTQILFNGRPPIGKNPLEIDVAEIERIEIIKSSIAEIGPFGIAGTINIIGKKLERKTFQQATTGVQGGAGIYGVNGSWSINEADLSSPWAWNLRVSASQKPNRVMQNLAQSQFDSNRVSRKVFDGKSQSNSFFDVASLSSGIVYRPNSEHEFTFSPALGYFSTKSESEEQRRYKSAPDWTIGSLVYSTMQGFDLPLVWRCDVEDEGKLQIDFKLSSNQIKGNNRTANQTQNMIPNVQSAKSREDSQSQSLHIEHERSFDGGHDIKLGLRWTLGKQNTEYFEERNGDVDTRLSLYGQQSHIEEEARRLFIQDDWRINRQWAINAGVSGERRSIKLGEVLSFGQTKFQLWSPSVHLARKNLGNNKSQFRFSIARNFKAPELNELLIRPSINPLTACLSRFDCPTNSLDTSDRTGNPQLQPERAMAVNASYEHGISADSQITFELYQRSISNKIGSEISLQAVPWSNQERYVYRPSNLGNAVIYGASLEWKIALRDVLMNAPKIDIRGNIVRAYSRVSDLPSPYNHLEGQMPWRAKLGMSHAVVGIPLHINIDANWLPSDWIRNNQTQTSYESRLASYSASAIWTPNPSIKVSLNLNNIFAANRFSIKGYQANGVSIQRASEKNVYTQIGLRLEMKL